MADETYGKANGTLHLFSQNKERTYRKRLSKRLGKKLIILFEQGAKTLDDKKRHENI